MIVLHEKIDVARPPREAFAYIADFSTTEEWDATATDARKTTPGPIDRGTRFEVVCSLPLGSVTLDYTITRLEPDRLIELQGTSRFFTVTDTITFEETASGAHIDYRARFTFKGFLARLAPRFTEGMRRMGRASVEGLREALEDNYPPPKAAPDTQRADRWLLPGLLHFTRAGYRRGRKRWNPVSAWMGGKHVVVTGASSGLGRAAAIQLARRGAELTLVIRNEEKARELVDAIRRETGNHRIHVELADLALIKDVDGLAARLRDKGKSIDVLINNAGALFNPRQVTSEGFEKSFALLLLSPFRLTLGLYPLLVGAGNARVVNVVSGGMYTQTLDVDLLQAPEPDYSGSVAYARCKRALMVVTEQWAQAWADQGIVVNAMHPGWADTPGVQSALPGFHRLTRRILRSPAEGADTMVWLAMATEAGKVTGALFLDREPRTTHLKSTTRESTMERERLQTYLAQFAPPQAAEAPTAVSVSGTAA
jgi:NAD(P)-dependent dehydrogenase (short-subunit alcohol dehydrogenase family)